MKQIFTTRLTSFNGKKLPFYSKFMLIGSFAFFLLSACASQGSNDNKVKSDKTVQEIDHSTIQTNAEVPGIGQTWLADYGDNTPFGPFASEITFESSTRLSFEIVKGSLKGTRGTQEYVAAKVRDGLYILQWKENNGPFVTHVEDWKNGKIVGIILGDKFPQMTGTWTKVR